MLSRKFSIFLTSLTLLFATSASAAPAKILPLGDSITSDGGNSAYRNELFDKLTTAGYNFEFVGSLTDNDQEGLPPVPTSTNGTKHEGRSGWEAGEIGSSLGNWIVNYDVDVALIHLGTNDIIKRLPNAGPTDGTPTTNAKQTLTELEEIIGIITTKNSNADIFVAKILPLGTIKDANGNYTPTPPNLTNGYSAPLNGKLTDDWATGKNITLVDQNAGFTASDMRSLLIHPNANGEEKMAKRWFDALKAAAVLPPKLTLTSPVTTTGGVTFTVGATSTALNSLAGTITYESTNDSICEVNPTTGLVTPQGEGLCEVFAKQAKVVGSYAATTSNTVSITVTATNHTVSFANNTPLSKTYGDVPFEVEATSKKIVTAPAIPQPTDLPVTITVRPTSSAICTIDATNKVTILKAGLCKLFAKAGGAVGTGSNRVLYKTKTTVPADDYIIIIAKATQTITFDSNVPSSITYGIAPFEVSATSDSTNPNLPVTLGTTTQNVCAYNATTKKLTIKSAGTCTLKAAQSGDDRYEAAATITTDIVVTTTPQTITFPEISDKTFGSAPFILNATSSSGLDVSYISTTTNICTVSGNKVTLLKVGHCKIIASAGSSTVSSVTASREFDVIPNAEQNTYDTVVKILNGNGNAATTNTQLKLIGLKKLNPNFDYTQALKKGSYKNKSKAEVIKEMQRIIDKENTGNLETAGSSSAAWLLLFGVIALYRRNRFVKNTMSCRNR